MNSQNFYTVFYFLLTLICFNSIASKQNKFHNVQIEFRDEVVKHGLLHKFTELFEDVPNTESVFDNLEDEYFDAINADDPEMDFDDILNSVDEYDQYDEYIQEDEYTQENEDDLNLNKMIETHVDKIVDDEMNENYKQFVYKLCLLTTVTKETTIYATENVRL